MERYLKSKKRLKPEISQYLEQIKEQLKLIEINCESDEKIVENTDNKQSEYSSVLTALDEINFSNNENILHDWLQKNKCSVQEKAEIDLGKIFLNSTENINVCKNEKNQEESVFYSESENSENPQQADDNQILLIEELSSIKLEEQFQEKVKIEENSQENIKVEENDEVQKQQKKQITKPRGPYKKYTFQQKSLIIQKIKQNESIIKLSQEYKIDTKTLKRWAEVGAYRKPGGGRKVQVTILKFHAVQIQDEAMEAKLIQVLIQIMMKTKQKVPKSTIKKLAKEFSKFSNFKASKGWFNNFINRYNYMNLEKSIIEKL